MLGIENSNVAVGRLLLSAVGDKAIKGVWTEIWTFRMCGKLINVPMTFVPDGKGGTSFISVAKPAETN